jgi:mono/diheme cytochrome c family protein
VISAMKTTLREAAPAGASSVALIAALSVAFLAAGRASAQQTGTDQTAGDPVAGKQLYYDHACYACHGFNGETGARDLVGTNSPLIADVNTFITFLRLRADQAPLFPSTRMPNYPESALSDSDARDIYAFIRTFELNAPDVEDVPALRAILDSASRPYEP